MKLILISLLFFYSSIAFGISNQKMASFSATGIPSVTIKSKLVTIKEKNTKKASSLKNAADYLCSRILDKEFKDSAVARAGYKALSNHCDILQAKTIKKSSNSQFGEYEVQAQLFIVIGK